MSRETVRIASGNNQLIGIHDSSIDRDVCVIMLSAGLQNRCGPRRFYWKAANALRQDFGILRVDLSGAGDTTSEARAYHFDLHDSNEVCCVIDYVQQTLGYSRVILFSLCAGARVALKTASKRKDVAGVVALNSPVVTGEPLMPVSPMEPVNRVSRAQSKIAAKGIVKFICTFRFLRPQWWRNRMKPGRSATADALRYLRSVRLLLGGKNSEGTRKKVSGKVTFVDTINKLVRDDRKVLFVYGSYDKKSFDEFLENCPEIQPDVGSQSYQLIDRGDHVFGTISTQEQVISATRNWLRQFERANLLDASS